MLISASAVVFSCLEQDEHPTIFAICCLWQTTLHLLLSLPDPVKTEVEAGMYTASLCSSPTCPVSCISPVKWGTLPLLAKGLTVTSTSFLIIDVRECGGVTVAATRSGVILMPNPREMTLDLLHLICYPRLLPISQWRLGHFSSKP